MSNEYFYLGGHDFPAHSIADIEEMEGFVYMYKVTRRKAGQDAEDYLEQLSEELGVGGELHEASLLADAIYAYGYVRAKECSAAEIAADRGEWCVYHKKDLDNPDNAKDNAALVTAVRAVFGDKAGDEQAAALKEEA